MYTIEGMLNAVKWMDQLVKRLAGEHKAPLPAARRQLQAEMKVIDAILEAADGKAEKTAYWRELSPMVQAMLVHRVDPSLEQELIIQPQDARAVYRQWWTPGKLNPPTEGQLKLMAQYDAEKQQIRQQYEKADKQLTVLEMNARQQAKDAWNAYLTGAAALDGTLRALIGYELAKRQPASGQSGFHMHKDEMVLPAPFRWFDWIYWRDPQDGTRRSGTSFRIEPACFAGRTAVMWYSDQDGCPADQEALRLMEQLSDGLTGFELAQRNGKQYVLFRFAENAPDGYLLAVPHAGEFDCEIGEVVDDAYVLLHEDHYCMK